MIHQQPHPLAGQTVKVKLGLRGAPHDFRVEDWWDRVSGQSWKCAQVPAAFLYACHAADCGLPLDDEVVYGKAADGLGRLVHVSELDMGGAS